MLRQQAKSMRKGKPYILGGFKLTYTSVVPDREFTKKADEWKALKINKSHSDTEILTYQWTQHPLTINQFYKNNALFLYPWKHQENDWFFNVFKCIGGDICLKWINMHNQKLLESKKVQISPLLKNPNTIVPHCLDKFLLLDWHWELLSYSMQAVRFHLEKTTCSKLKMRRLKQGAKYV